MTSDPNVALTPLWGRRAFYKLPFTVVSDLYKARHLLALLVKRDLTSRYRRAYLGYGWAVLEPLLLAGVYTFLFTILIGTTDQLYPVKIIIGIIGWQLFSRSLTNSTRSISSSINLFQFARIPKSVFATSTMLTNFVLALVSLTCLIPFFFIHNLVVGIHLIFIPFWLFLLSLIGWGIGLMLAPIACKVPDIINLVNFLVRAGFFLSPVMWTYDMFEKRFGTGWEGWIAHLNPTIVPLTEMRNAVVGEPVIMQNYGYAIFVVICLASYILGSIIFELYAHKAVVNV